MRFAALVKKELKEILIWATAAGITFAFFGLLILWYRASHPHNYYYWQEELGQSIGVYNFTNYSQPLKAIRLVLLAVSVLLAVVIAAVQFDQPNKLKTWPFLIHRSVRRSTILLAKFTASAAAFVVFLGSVWTLFFIYASKPNVFLYPPTIKDYLEGWIFITTAFILYCGAAPSSIAVKKQQINKISFAFIVPGFTVIICCLALLEGNFYLVLAILIIYLLILLLQTIEIFLNTEF